MRTYLAATCAAAAIAAILLVSPAHAADESGIPAPRAEGWLVQSYGQLAIPAMPKNLADERAALKAMTTKRTADDLARFRWWATGSTVHRWNELAVDELLENWVTLPLAGRHLALFHAALDDAIAVARHNTRQSRPAAIDAALTGPLAANAIAPSEHAAAAAAAADVLSYFFPARAALYAAKAEEAMQVRVMAGVEFPAEIAAGRAIGQKIASLAVARGKADRSEAKWSGNVPEGPGKWKGQNPIAPLAGTWQTWVLAQANEFRPPAPPAFDSEKIKADLNELKTFARTPKSNHKATYWEVFGGARAHTLWNEIARTKLLEHGASSQASSRVLAALNIAIADVGVACWEAKFSYWYIRPPQLDSELKTVFPAPNHPSYPAAHGCFSTAAATVVAAVFPRDRDRLLATGKEAAEARMWAGIHYRTDIDAGQELGRKVAERTLERAFGPRTQ
jgi:membrane-associated phospholipid phosphatase